MEIPEIQYRPEAPSAKFAPVQQVDVTAAMQDNQNRAIQDMNRRLQQMDRNAAVELQNVRDQAFPVEKLAQFSKTLEGFVQDRIDKKKKDDIAEGAMLAFTEGVPSDPVFDENEKQIDKAGSVISKRADAYERQTGDIETAERVRNLTGWKKYGYAKAQMEMAGKSFGAFVSTNKSNEAFSVNVGGQLYTLASAPNQAIRQAVTAKMATAYMQPYSGMNKSFLSKYLYPGMQIGMQQALAETGAAHAKLMRANRLDAALTAFRGDPTPTSMMELDNILRNDGYDNRTIRANLISEMIKVESDDKFQALLEQTYGPNGKQFQEQYPLEVAELRIKRQEFLQRDVQEREIARQTQDREDLEEAKQLVASDIAKDGELNANPEKLEEFAQQARLSGSVKTAEYWESQIANTAAMQKSADLKKQYEMQIMAGVVPSINEIRQNPGLSIEHKQALLSTAQASGQAAPASVQSDAHEKEIQDSIRQRGKWTRAAANDPGVGHMESKALSQYKAVYNRELESGKTPEQAAQAAISDFRAEFSKEDNGAYALIKPGSPEAKDNPSRIGKYAGYDPTGVSSTVPSAISQVDDKLRYADVNTVLNTYPDLFQGEEKILNDLLFSFNTTGMVGTIPPVYYQLQQRYGGNVSIMDLVNKRLEANGLEPLPKELNQILKPIEGVFDDETYKYVSYKPNTTRTDIALINSGEEPVYSTTLPTNVASDIEFQQEVSAVAGRLGISEADLMAVMSFETGGTFDPSVINAAGSGARGLIQFMPSTARGLGTTTEALAQMSRVEQMQYVEKYLSNKNLRGKGLSDIYMGVLFPAAVGQPDDFVLFGNGATTRGYGAGSKAYAQNKGLDSNGDGSVTKAEAAAKVMQHRNPNPWRRPNNMVNGLQ